MGDLDGVIAQLRTRVGDPERRVDVPGDAVATTAPDPLARLGVLRADELASLVGIDGGLRPPAAPGELATVGTVIGVDLPRVLRRALAEIADGGFGPGHGLLGTADLVRVTGRCRRDGLAGAPWPSALLPVAELEDGVLACAATDDPDAPVWAIHPDRPAERAQIAPTLALWLQTWADR